MKKSAEVIVIGGGLGGTMAAYAAASEGLSVILTEETDWLGGQLTSQGVPPDEHEWIEEFGCTATYRAFREKVRDYYKDNYLLTDEAKADPLLNPGNAWVSRISHEPKVALHVIEEMLSPFVKSKQLQIYYHYKPISATTTDNKVNTVTVAHIESQAEIILSGQYFIDATECGDVLPLADVEYVIGAESSEETGEPHALSVGNPIDIQSFTFVFALDYQEGADYTIEEPDRYGFWKNYMPDNAPHPLLSWYAVDAENTETFKEFTLLENDEDIPSLFTYRRVLDTDLLKNGTEKRDISLINWPQNDYYLGSIVDVSEKEKQANLLEAKQLGLSLLYWLQTEAPRPDGTKGFPGLRLRKDVLGTEDGFAKYPYIRESRRIKAVHTITEQDISKEIRGDKGIRKYFDSVGVGSYHIDLHHTVQTQRTHYIKNTPYEIPLGALLPKRMRNLLPACKNIGTTQMSNGCYRVHPTEWNIGESVGYLVAYALGNDIPIHQVREEQTHLTGYQDLLVKRGIELHWPEDIVY